MRIASFGLTVILLFAALSPAQSQAQERTKPMNVRKITAVLFAEEIEPCVKFWVERLGFQKTIEVPDGNKLAFATLEKGNVELMYQTYASADKDVGAVSQAIRKGPSFLYVEVDNLDLIISAVKGADVVISVRTTFYGAKEIGIKDPAGHIITFAQFGAPAPK